MHSRAERSYPGFVWKFLYFVCSFLGCTTLACWTAYASVRAKGFSHVEGDPVYAILLQVPPWLGFFVLLSWLAFVPLRRHPVVLAAATLAFALLSIRFFAMLAYFLS